MLTLNKKVVGDIPYFEILPVGERVKADILLYHGWGSHAMKQCFRGKIFAGFGYRVLVPEIAMHGERGECNYDDADSVITFLEVLSQSIHEAEVLIRKELSSERARFVVGHSLGGMIALGAAAENANFINGFVAMNSTANWGEYEKIMKGVFPGKSLEILNSARFVAVAKTLMAYDPKNWHKQKMMQSVLLTNGALDQTLPADFNATFCKENPELHLKQMIFPDAGHVVTDGMIAEVLGFIENHT